MILFFPDVVKVQKTGIILFVDRFIYLYYIFIFVTSIVRKENIHFRGLPYPLNTNMLCYIDWNMTKISVTLDKKKKTKSYFEMYRKFDYLD